MAEIIWRRAAEANMAHRPEAERARQPGFGGRLDIRAMALVIVLK